MQPYVCVCIQKDEGINNKIPTMRSKNKKVF